MHNDNKSIQVAQAKTPNQVLTAMAWMLEHVGWTRGLNFRNNNGENCSSDVHNRVLPPACMCIFGAWQLVEADRNCKDIAWSALNCVSHSQGRGAIRFNDWVAKNKQDVLDLIQRAQAYIAK